MEQIAAAGADPPADRSRAEANVLLSPAVPRASRGAGGRLQLSHRCPLPVGRSGRPGPDGLRGPRGEVRRLPAARRAPGRARDRAHARRRRPNGSPRSPARSRRYRPLRPARRRSGVCSTPKDGRTSACCRKPRRRPSGARPLRGVRPPLPGRLRPARDSCCASGSSRVAAGPRTRTGAARRRRALRRRGPRVPRGCSSFLLEGSIGKRGDPQWVPAARAGAGSRSSASRAFVVGGWTGCVGSRPSFGALFLGVHRSGATRDESARASPNGCLPT